ncbi:glycoside hydrolase family 76 protein [Paraflavitalea sp. CAU 1676]|uniref:glycoside hydrolase family 76 protein n=1 Tax=Paraflavitalea sp. CAU 1676 TaxID=3032598 RepID=UPI0023DC70A1|nr:glycoside hydrolase family 76 protein [Paraflavitalea sp. CAU 1676]MDF2191287.1 glycoside hydrolase family 76 protein [Paraflavitalea sp. CAU 1676]
MKLTNLFLCVGTVLLLMIDAAAVRAQTAGIESGAIYKIRSKANNKLLNVSNSSLANGANVDIWTDTDSDAERWRVVHVSGNNYTLQNIGTEKYLHLANATPANSVNVDQGDNSNNNQVRWNIVNNGDASFSLRAAANTGFSADVVASGAADGTDVALWTNHTNSNQRWGFEKVTDRPAAPTAAIADAVFAAWKTKYYDARTGNQIIPNEGFWGVAEMMEIVVDAYEVTGQVKYKTLFDEMYGLFIAKEGQDWMWNEYNDDITWMVLACVRMGLRNSNQTYLNKAKDQFDKMYARATRDNGNWLVWKQGTPGTNSCINGPAMVACMYLYQAFNDITYVNKAVTLYNWSKNNLFEPATGKVYDNNNNGTINYWSSTYNQGTYLGASVMLYNHTNDASYLTNAINIAQYTKVTMYNSGVINNEEGPDLNGFKGIFPRYARRYIVDCNRPDFISWLQLNGRVAYNNRNTENIIRTLWGTRAAQGTYYAGFNASTAVSLLINTPYTATTNQYATVYKNCNYTGGGVPLRLGRYTLNDLIAAGVKNDDISSIRVAAGYRVIVYWDDNYTGSSLTLTADDGCLVDNGWNDQVSSLEVVATTAAPLTSATNVTGNVQVDKSAGASGFSYSPIRLPMC